MRRKRRRVAAQELAEADKIKIVTAAEAEAEKKNRLHRGRYCRATEGYCRCDWQTLLKS